MASTPDPNPDSVPAGPADSPEQVTPETTPRRESVEDVPGGENSTGGAG
ncbi:hypothetical protein [Sphingomonas sp.]|nr:hypothetical protein [Sphingomonas sp.]